jgi:hypothetical protein
MPVPNGVRARAASWKFLQRHASPGSGTFYPRGLQWSCKAGTLLRNSQPIHPCISSFPSPPLDIRSCTSLLEAASEARS